MHPYSLGVHLPFGPFYVGVSPVHLPAVAPASIAQTIIQLTSELHLGCHGWEEVSTRNHTCAKRESQVVFLFFLKKKNESRSKQGGGFKQPLRLHLLDGTANWQHGPLRTECSTSSTSAL